MALVAPSKLRAGALIFAAWSLFGLSLGQQVYVLQDGRGPAGVWSHAMALQLHYCLIWALVTPAVLWLGRRFPVLAPRARRARGFWWRAAVHLPAGLACSVIVQITHGSLLSQIFSGWFPQPVLSDLARSAMINVDYGFLLYWLVLLLGQAFDYVRSLDQAQLRQAELQEQLTHAQLQALRMQMHPHFLFNALNSIAELIHDSPNAAEQMVNGLGDLLRIYLRSSETQEVALAQEIDFLRRYLAIQQVRFDDRLTVDIELDPGAHSAVVPSLILQPLVENAILHGIADRERDGVIRIRAALDRSSLALSVTDNGPGFACADRPLVEGKGLHNTRRRLERLYGEHHDFSVRTVDGGGTCAALRLPLKHIAPGAPHAEDEDPHRR
ncbi:MAG TPA: histidine kinase [Kofleriaceae bacterium]|jgi:signal transduction histidine kinase|nr:histidine kinase [Kofleriaceae bacterium]